MSDKKNYSLIILFLQQRFITQIMHNTVGALKLGLNGWQPAVFRKKKNNHCSLKEANINGNIFVF